MDELEKFRELVRGNVAAIERDQDFGALGRMWLREAVRHRYPLNFQWLGRPVIQSPPDIYAVQEIVWQVKPDLIIETGIAHGGSLIMSASLLALLDYCEAAAAGLTLDPRAGGRRVIGIDIDIRAHNRTAIEAHPLAHMIRMVQGSSIDPEVVAQVRAQARDARRVLVFLDSNHSHDHVLAELEAYAPLVAPGSYCVVWDTGIEDMPDELSHDRPWGKGNNPKTAVRRYLRLLASEGRTAADGHRLKFESDRFIEHKLAITGAPEGFLLRVDA